MKNVVTVRALVLAATASVSLTALAATDSKSHTVTRFDRPPSVQCNIPLSKFRVVYQLEKPDRGGEFVKSIEAGYVCIEKQRVATESGMFDIKMHLMATNKAYRNTVISVTAMTE